MANSDENTEPAWITSTISICSLISLEQHLPLFRNVLSLIPLNELKEKLDSYQLRTKYLPLQDTLSEDLFQYLDESIKFINESVQSNQTLAIVCVSGISRSVSFGIAYLIKYEHFILKDALLHVRKVRPVACPNEAFMFQLQLFQDGHTTFSIGYVYLQQLLISSTLFQESLTWSKLTFPEPVSISNSNFSFACSQCRHFLFFSSNILPSHHASSCSLSKDYFSIISTQALLSSIDLSSNLHFKGKLYCPNTRHQRKCHAKLGFYVWISSPCPMKCNAILLPSFWIQKKAVYVLKN